MESTPLMHNRQQQRPNTFGLIHILIILSIIVFGVFLEFKAINEWLTRAHLTSSGNSTEGFVIKKRIDDDRGKHYFIMYGFTMSSSDGSVIPQVNEEEVSYEQYSDLWPGDKIEISYDPDSGEFRSDLNPQIGFLYLGCGLWSLLAAASWIFGYKLTNYKFRMPFSS
jgi:hypothetical protein